MTNDFQWKIKLIAHQLKMVDICNSVSTIASASFLSCLFSKYKTIVIPSGLFKKKLLMVEQTWKISDPLALIFRLTNDYFDYKIRTDKGCQHILVYFMMPMNTSFHV